MTTINNQQCSPDDLGSVMMMIVVDRWLFRSFRDLFFFFSVFTLRMINQQLSDKAGSKTCSAGVLHSRNSKETCWSRATNGEVRVGVRAWQKARYRYRVPWKWVVSNPKRVKSLVEREEEQEGSGGKENNNKRSLEE